MAITQSEVDGDAELDLAAAKDILQERVAFVEDQVVEPDPLVPTTAVEVVFELALAQLGDVASEVAQVDVFARFLRLEELKANLALRILVR